MVVGIAHTSKQITALNSRCCTNSKAYYVHYNASSLPCSCEGSLCKNTQPSLSHLFPFCEFRITRNVGLSSVWVLPVSKIDPSSDDYCKVSGRTKSGLCLYIRNFYFRDNEYYFWLYLEAHN